jgi:PAS domain S-box-containing protein
MTSNPVPGTTKSFFTNRDPIDWLCIALSLPIILTIIFSHFWIQEIIEDSLQKVTLALKADVALKQVLSNMQDAETGQRGYLLTNEKHYLEPYNDAINNVDTDIKKLKDILPGTSINKRLIVEINVLVNQKLKELAQTISLWESNEKEASLALVKSDVGKNIMDSLREKIQAYCDLEERHLINIKADTLEKESWASLIEITAVIMLIILAGFMIVRLRFQAKALSRTAQKHTQELDKKSEELKFLNSALNAHAIASITDVKGNITYVNKKMCDISGYSAEELLGKNHNILKSHHHTQDFYADLWSTIANGKVWHGEIKNKMKNGSYYWVDSTIVPFVTKEGKPFQYISIRTDITNRKDAEEKAQIAVHAKSAFLANMSHEIRTPMNGVIGMVDVLMQLDLKAEHKDMVRTIRRSSFSLLHIINDILDTSKIEAGKLNIDYTAVHLQACIEGVVETVSPISGNKNIILDVFIDPDIPLWINSDKIRLRQILLNLLSNAIKFSKPSGKKKSAHVKFFVECLNEHTLQFTVSDNGIGMDKKALSNLFKSFSQGEESTTRKFGGTGLGLMISKNLIELMNGNIKTTSILGSGSTFTFTLPLTKADCPSNSSNISELNIVILKSQYMPLQHISRYLEYGEANLCLVETEADLAEKLDSEKEQVIIILAEETAVKNERIRDSLQDNNDLHRFLLLNQKLSSRSELIPANSHEMHRSPLWPSKFIYGLTLLSGREEPLAAINAEEHDGVIDFSGVQQHNQQFLILLVEDNEVNRDVIQHQLTLLGYKVDLTEDGEQGLSAWATGKYDLILTDCHMPVMDGFCMAKRIRQEEENTKQNPATIIAITASALKGEADLCFAAGMDDYMTKPIELVRLKRTLENWLPSQYLASSGNNERAANDSKEKFDDDQKNPAIDISSMKQFIGDNPAMHRQFLDAFLAPATLTINEIHDAFNAHLAEKVGERAHKLKSSARTIGANALADLCEHLEIAGHAANWESIETLHRELDDCFQLVQGFIENNRDAL